MLGGIERCSVVIAANGKFVAALENVPLFSPNCSILAISIPTRIDLGRCERSVAGRFFNGHTCI